jgi:cell division protein FtsX
MNALRLAFQLAMGTLRSRPTLTILAVLLLAFGTAIMGGLLGSIYLLRSLQNEFVSALSVELELTSDTDTFRSSVMSRCEAWPSAEFVQYVPPEAALHEVQRETGEDLLALFGANPFPALVRVRFGEVNLKTLDSLTAAARRWPEVAEVSYPRRLWSDLQRIADRFQGSLGLIAAAITLLVLILVGLCLRAQIRNRSAQWEFLLLCGMHPREIFLSRIVQEVLIGLLSGLTAGGILYGLTMGYSWLMFRGIALPFWFYGAEVFLAVMLSLLAGFLSPRRFE